MTEPVPAFDELMAERDRMFKKHPKTQVHRGPHVAGTPTTSAGWQSSSTSRRTCTAELGAVLYDLGRQPRAAREFFIKYQDRILFGKDTSSREFPYYWRVFETADEYFDYYRDYHAFWKLYGP